MLQRTISAGLLLVITSSCLALQAGRFKLESFHKVETSAQDFIDWDISYPAFNPNTTVKIEQNFNAAITDIVDTEKSTFLSTVYAVDRKDLPQEFAKNNNTLKMTYEVKLVSGQPEPLVSVLFTVDTYVVGAAHPNATHRTFNFNFKTGEPMAIAELFKKNADFVKPLNAYIAKQLRSTTHKSEKEMVADNEINYANWNITKDGLLVTMDEFPHVLGLVQVLVPYATLKKYLDLQGPLSICLTQSATPQCL